MIIKNAKFITSAVDKKGFLHPDKPLIAICGKSNVGKKSRAVLRLLQKKTVAQIKSRFILQRRALRKKGARGVNEK